MVLRFLLSFLFCSQVHFAFGQNTNLKKQEQSARNFLDGYNSKNFKAMKKEFHWVLKIVIGKKMMAEICDGLSETFGTLEFVDVVPKKDKAVDLILLSHKDPTEKQVMALNFSRKNKLTGFRFNNNPYNYKKDTFQLASSPMPFEAKALKLDEMLDDKFKRGNFNGCVLAMDDDGKVYKKCKGYADFETQTGLNDSTVFNLASVSKHFTAMGIMILAGQNKISYVDSLHRFFPGLPKTYRNITIEQLLTHTSGLPDYMGLFAKHWDKQKMATNTDVLEMFTKQRPKNYFKPGSRYSYSNTGYVMLASVIEKVSGQSFEAFMSQHIFQPLGMKHTFIYGFQRKPEVISDNYAYGYVYSDSLGRYIIPDSLPKYDYVVYLNGIHGDGNVNTSLNDYMLWDKALRQHTLVGPETMEKAYAKHSLPKGQKINYGYGMSINKKEGYEPLVQHSGGWPGFYTQTIRFLEKEKTVLVLSNNEYLSTGKLADRIAKVLLGMEGE